MFMSQYLTGEGSSVPQLNLAKADIHLAYNDQTKQTVKQGRATAQAISRRPLTAEARVRSRVGPCGICG